MLTMEYGRPKSASGRSVPATRIPLLVVRHDRPPFRRNGFLIRACRDGTSFLEYRHPIHGPTVVRPSDRQRGCEHGVRLRVGNDVVGLRPCARLINRDDAEAKDEGRQTASELAHGF